MLGGHDHFLKALEVFLWGDIVGSFKGSMVEVAPHYVPHIVAIEILAQDVTLSLCEFLWLLCILQQQWHPT